MDALPEAETYQLNNRIFFRLFQVANTLQRQAVQQLGVTTVQWAVLGALSQERMADGIPMASLAEYLVVSRQNLDGVLKRLERDGMVQRVTDTADRRGPGGPPPPPGGAEFVRPSPPAPAVSPPAPGR